MEGAKARFVSATANEDVVRTLEHLYSMVRAYGQM